MTDKERSIKEALASTFERLDRLKNVYGVSSNVAVLKRALEIALAA